MCNIIQVICNHSTYIHTYMCIYTCAYIHTCQVNFFSLDAADRKNDVSKANKVKAFISSAGKEDLLELLQVPYIHTSHTYIRHIHTCIHISHISTFIQYIIFIHTYKHAYIQHILDTYIHTYIHQYLSGKRLHIPWHGQDMHKGES